MLKFYFLFISLFIAVLFSIDANANPKKIQNLLKKNKIQEAIWIASEAKDYATALRLELILEECMKSDQFNYKKVTSPGASSSLFLHFSSGIIGILKADQWRPLNPVSWIFGNKWVSNSDSEIAAYKIDRLFRFDHLYGPTLLKSLLISGYWKTSLRP